MDNDTIYEIIKSCVDLILDAFDPTNLSPYYDALYEFAVIMNGIDSTDIEFENYPIFLYKVNDDFYLGSVNLFFDGFPYYDNDGKSRFDELKLYFEDDVITVYPFNLYYKQVFTEDKYALIHNLAIRCGLKVGLIGYWTSALYNPQYDDKLKIKTNYGGTHVDSDFMVAGIDELLQLKLFDVNLYVWTYLRQIDSIQFTYNDYASDFLSYITASFGYSTLSNINRAETSLLFYLKKLAWIPNNEGIMFEPADIRFKDIHPDFLSIKPTYDGDRITKALDIGRKGLEYDAYVEKAKEYGLVAIPKEEWDEYIEWKEMRDKDEIADKIEQYFIDRIDSQKDVWLKGDFLRYGALNVDSDTIYEMMKMDKSSEKIYDCYYTIFDPDEVNHEVKELVYKPSDCHHHLMAVMKVRTENEELGYWGIHILLDLGCKLTYNKKHDMRLELLGDVTSSHQMENCKKLFNKISSKFFFFNANDLDFIEQLPIEMKHSVLNHYIVNVAIGVIEKRRYGYGVRRLCVKKKDPNPYKISYDEWEYYLNASIKSDVKSLVFLLKDKEERFVIDTINTFKEYIYQQVLKLSDIWINFVPEIEKLEYEVLKIDNTFVEAKCKKCGKEVVVLTSRDSRDLHPHQCEDEKN